jgi:hypothetical protein
MTGLSEPNISSPDLDELLRLRALAFAFQRMIANLDANEQNNDYNERFNRIHGQTKAILSKYDLKLTVPRVVTTGVLAERGQKVSTRLTGIVIFGVMLALVGLGINSIILEDVIINSLGCLISSGGMLLVIGALAVWGVTSGRRKLDNLGDVYLHCEMLLQQLDQVLSGASPGYGASTVVETPNIPSAATLALDSLEKQIADWQEKLATLTQQQRLLGSNAPVELTTTINYVQRELDRLEYELVDLQERVEFPLPPQPTAAPSPPVVPPLPVEPDSGAARVARAYTQEMPALTPDLEPEAQPEKSESEPEEDTPLS